MFKSVVKKIMGASASLVLGAGLLAGCTALADGSAGYEAEADSARVAVNNSSVSNGINNVIYVKGLGNVGTPKDYTYINLYSMLVKANNGYNSSVWTDASSASIYNTSSSYKSAGVSSKKLAFYFDTDKFDKRFKSDSYTAKEYIKKMKSDNPNVKYMMCLGGGDDGRDDYELQELNILRAIEINKTDFVDKLVSTVENYGLDGIDLDWEYYPHHFKKTSDKSKVYADWYSNKHLKNWSESYVTETYDGFVKELSSKLKNKGKKLTIAVVNEKRLWGSSFYNCFDCINVMVYDSGDKGIVSYYDSYKKKLAYGISYENGKVTTSNASSLVKSILEKKYGGIMAWDYSESGKKDLQKAVNSAIKNYKDSSSTPAPVDPVDPVEPGNPLTVKFSSSTKILSKSASNFGNSTTGAVIVSNGTAKVENGRLKLTKFDASKPIDVYVRFTDAPASGKVKVNTASSTRSIQITGLDEVDTEGDTRKSLFSSSKTLNTPQDGYDSSYTVSADVSLKKTYGWVHIQYKYASGKSASSSHTLYVDNVKIQ